MTKKRKNPHAVALGRRGGKATTAKKAAAVRENGKKGGRPPATALDAAPAKIQSQRPKMLRSTADRLLKELLARTAEINAPDSPYAWRVKQLYVFGSYLKGADRSNDLDIVYVLERLYGSVDDPRQRALEEARRGLYRKGWWFERLCYPHTEVLRYLRGRSGRVSVHDYTYLGWLQDDQKQPVKLVFEWANPHGEGNDQPRPGGAR